jgi:iron-sulfur cluster assembly protein
MAQPQVTVLPGAEKFMRLMVRFSGHSNGGFRLVVTSGGCSGYSSQFSVEPRPLEGDTELLVNGLRLFLPADTAALLEGVTVDHTDAPGNSGLTFVNPNCAACACGDAAASGQASVALSSIKKL